MAVRRPLVIVNGVKTELPIGDTISGAPGGTVSITSATLDFGRTPTHEKTFTVVDSLISPASKILLTPGEYNETDENADESYYLRWQPGTGQFNVTVTAVRESVLLQGIFKINYIIS